MIRKSLLALGGWVEQAEWTQDDPPLPVIQYLHPQEEEPTMRTAQRQYLCKSFGQNVILRTETFFHAT